MKWKWAPCISPSGTPRQVRRDKYSSLWISSFLFLPDPGTGSHTGNKVFHYQDCWAREWLGQGQVKTPQSFLTILQLRFPWFTVLLVVVNRLMFSGVLRKLVLRDFAYFHISVEGLEFGAAYFAILLTAFDHLLLLLGFFSLAPYLFLQNVLFPYPFLPVLPREIDFISSLNFFCAYWHFKILSPSF